MFKGLLRTPDGPVLILGLSDGNVTRMKDHRPIVFPISELGLPGKLHIVISYQDKDRKTARPDKSFQPMIVLALDDRTLKHLEHSTAHMEVGNWRFELFRGKNEQELGDKMRGMVSPNTRVSVKGFSPSDRPTTQAELN